jgi:hypothetical protein
MPHPSLHRLNIGLLVWLSGMTLGQSAAADPVSATLSVSDAVTTPGRPVKLEARLVRAGPLMESGLGGEQLAFFVAGKQVGTAMTGGDGRAYLEYTPKMRGNQTVTVRLLPNKRVTAAEATATVGSWERRRPILLVERPALIEPARRRSLPDLEVLTGAEPSPAAGAAEELKRLAEFYFNIIYLEQTEDTGMVPRDFRQWLMQHGFPFGLRVTVQKGADGLSETFQALQTAGWENMQAGVGRSGEFGEALLKHRLRAVLIVPERDPQLPRRIQQASDWREARKLLQR